MPGEKFTLMQYSVNAILGLIEANDFVIPGNPASFVWKRSQVRGSNRFSLPWISHWVHHCLEKSIGKDQGWRIPKGKKS